MSISTAIGMVSESLRNLLAGEMKITPLPEVTVLAPDESIGGRSINLYLYKLIENPMLKNLDWQVKPGSPDKLMPPPLSLTLFYLMTPYSTNDPQTGNSPAHGMLGDAMRVFYENPIIPVKYLSDGIKNSREEIRVILNSLDLEELSKVWATFSKAYRLSVLYEVSVVQLDMFSNQEKELAKRVRTIGIPAIRTPYLMPVLNDITPIAGSAGSTVTARGQNLSGWKPVVVVSGQYIAPVSNLEEDSFQFTLPSNLLVGFYEIQVNIGDKVRKTYLFEIL